MLGLRGELLIPESPHGWSNACANAAWLGRAEVKCTGPTRRSHIYSDNTRGRSKQSRPCRRQKRKQCKQKLIRAWDTHVRKPTWARNNQQVTGRLSCASGTDVLWQDVAKWDQVTWTEEADEGQVAALPVSSICACPSRAGEKGAIEWKRKEGADFAQFSGHPRLPASSLTDDCGNKSEFFPGMSIYLLSLGGLNIYFSELREG